MCILYISIKKYSSIHLVIFAAPIFKALKIISFGFYFLAHLSRRLIGELLVYRGIRRPSVVRPSSTFSNDFYSEAAGPILLIFHI